MGIGTSVMDKEITYTEMLKLVHEAYKQAVAAGIPLNNRVLTEVKINRRYSKRIACCITNRRTGECRFEYSELLTHASPDKVIETWIHEWIHTLPDCKNHGEYFKYYASLANKKYGYKISRLGDLEYMGVSEENQLVNTNKKIQKNYVIYCNTCKKKVGQVTARAGVAKNPERYKCKNCKQSNLSVKVLGD